MDEKTLQDSIIKEANQDIFDGVGRIFVESFLEKTGALRQELLDALETFRYRYRFHSEDVLLIYFVPRDIKQLSYRFAWKPNRKAKFIGERI